MWSSRLSKPFFGILLLFSSMLIEGETQSLLPLPSKKLLSCFPDPFPATKFSEPYSTCNKETRDSLAQRHPDQNLNTPQILRKYKYPFKTYNNITTKDGYILTVYRVTGSPKSKPRAGKEAVYLNHGMGAASDNWNYQPGSRNLPFKLADAGYEVWLANCRGTTYSMKHKTLNPYTDIEYWDFSFGEMGVNDLPAVINTMTSVTKQEKVFYVGHSMGTTQYFIGLSEIPELNNKIKAGFMLAPIAYVGHMTSVFRCASPLMDTYEKYQAFNTLLLGRIQSDQDFRQAFHASLGDICDPTAAKCGLCDNLIFLLFGYDAAQMNNTELPNIVAKYPNNLSIKTFAHYAQMTASSRFNKFDYGEVGNMKAYKSMVAPEYQLKNIFAPTYFYYAENDNLGPPIDVNITASKMAPGVLKEIIKVKDDQFNHIDFAVAKDADLLVYNDMLEKMNSLSQK